MQENFQGFMVEFFYVFVYLHENLAPGRNFDVFYKKVSEKAINDQKDFLRT